MTIEELKRVAGGISVPTQPAPPAQVQFVQNAPGCSLQTSATATPESVQIDSSQLIGKACAHFEVDVDTTGTAISTALLWILGINANQENEAQIRRIYASVPANETVFDTAAAVDQIPGDGTTFANFGLTDYLNQSVFISDTYLISTIHFKNEGTAAVFATIKATSWLSRGSRLEGNYESTKLNIAPDRCSPCFNSDDDVVEWNLGGLPISNTEALMFILPDATDGVFRFCVDSISRVRNYIACAGGR